MTPSKTDKLKEQHTNSKTKSYEQSRKKINIKNKLKKIFLIFFFGFICLLCIGTAAGVYFLSQFTKDLPDFTKDFEKPFTGNSIMYDRNGKELYRLRSPYTDREVISNISEVPDIVKWSFIMAEDQKFYEHPGIDFQRILVAGSKAITNNFAGGASTIDQQVLKNSTLRNEAYSGGDQYSRKIKEVILALQLDKKYSKDDILKYYLNIVPIRSDVVGAKTGARKLFSKDMNQLTLGEATLLASLANSPVTLDPFSQGDPIYCNEQTGETVSVDALVKGEDGNPLETEGKFQGIKGSIIIKAPNYKCRQLYVLDQMSLRLDKINLNGSIITQDDIIAARTAPLEFKRPVEVKLAKQFVDYAIKDLGEKDFILNGPGYENIKLDSNILREGELRIYTTLNLDYQNMAQNEIKNWIDNSNNGGNLKELNSIYNGAMGLIDVDTREILIMVGSKDPYASEFEGHNDSTGLNKFDPETNVLTSIQNVGSSSKPLGFLAGFETGSLNPASFLPNMPISINGYSPQNAGGGPYNGTYSFNNASNLMRNSLRKSYNVTAIQAADIIGVPAIKSIYERFGYPYIKDWETGLSIMIGAEVRPIDHINGYATIAANGLYKPQQSIREIQDKFGNILWKYDPNLNAKQVIDPRATYLVSDVIYNYGDVQSMMQNSKGVHVYGKTGTSDGNKDLVVMAYTPSLAFGMWVGNNDNSDVRGDPYPYNKVQPALFNIMNQILPNYPNEKIKQPDGIVERAVCTVSGKLPNSAYPCPSTIVEKFMADKLPPIDDTYSGQVTVCTDKPASDPTAKPIYKTARQTDIDYGYSKVENWPYVRTIIPAHQKMFDTWSKQKQKTEAVTCDTDYSTIAGQPAVTITSPTIGQSFLQGSSMNINVSAVGFLGQVNDIKVYFDSTLAATSVASMLDTNYLIPISTVPGNHIIQITATDIGGRSQNQTITITVTALPVIVTSSSTTSSSVTNDTKTFILISQNSYTVANTAVVPITIIGNVTPGNGPYGNAILNITAPGYSESISMNRSGSTFTGNWTPPAGLIKTYTIVPVYTSPNGNSSSANAVTVVVN